MPPSDTEAPARVAGVSIEWQLNKMNVTNHVMVRKVDVLFFPRFSLTSLTDVNCSLHLS